MIFGWDFWSFLILGRSILYVRIKFVRVFVRVVFRVRSAKVRRKR